MIWSAGTHARPRPEHPLLGDARDEPSVLGEDPRAREAAAALRRRGVLDEEQPLVRARGTMPPHGVIEAREREILGRPESPWRRSSGSSITWSHPKAMSARWVSSGTSSGSRTRIQVVWKGPGSAGRPVEEEPST